MSGTRSPLRLAPATERPSLLIAAHGETGKPRGNAALLALADELRRRFPGLPIGAGVLNGAPRLEDAAAALPGGRTFVYPLFMSDGYFVERVLPRRLRVARPPGCPVEILAPLGLDPGLVDVVARRVRDAAPAISSLTKALTVLLVAHGSAPSPRSRLATASFAASLRARLGGPAVTTAYLEEPPFARDAVAGLPQRSVVVSFFAADGVHSGTDLPQMLHDAGRSNVPVVGPVGTDPEIASLVAAAIRKVVSAPRNAA